MPERGKVSIFGNRKTAADFAVEKWIEICTDSVENKGRFVGALSGGRTPIDFYTILSIIGKELPWAKIHLFFSDERFVPTTTGESNYRLAWECLLSHVNIPKNNIHRIDTEEVFIEIAAVKYEEEMRNFFSIGGDRIPEFDLILLGIGEDGHTASLFPGTPSLKEKKHIAIPVIAEKPPYKRISLTLPVLNNAKHIIILANGKNKAHAVKETIENKGSELPAALIKTQNGSLLFVIDEAAASLLSINKGTR